MKLYHELAEYYFAIESNHRKLKNDVLLILSLLKDKNNTTLLDLGCGTGEHICQLINHGIKCIGIDNSSEMLNIANKRFPNKTKFIKKDLSELDFSNEFDMVISLFGSFNYLLHNADIIQALQNTRKALKNEGLALFEIWNSLPIKKIGKKKMDHISTTEFNDVFIERERGFNILNYSDKTIVEVNYRYKLTKGNNTRLLRDKHIMRAYTKEEISKFLVENGFNIKGVYSNTSRELYNENSNRILIYFQKA